MQVLVTGGAGYIGSVMTETLIDHGHDVIVYDNLSTGHRDAVHERAGFVLGDMLDRETVAHTLRQHRIEAVVHMAGAALVGESMTDPAKYYEQNVQTGLTLLRAMHEAQVRNLVFSCTCAIFGEPVKIPMEEDDLKSPTNPYGASKLALEQTFPWYERAYGLRWVSLRYFNAAGATAARGERHAQETHLIPLVLQAAAGQRPAIHIFGDDYPTPDGTCIRDYIHVSDLAAAHVLALEAVERSPGGRVYNLGCGGAGYSVKQVIQTAAAVTGRAIPVQVSPRRHGDPAALVASSERIRRELGWTPERQNLDEIIRSAWTWIQTHPDLVQPLSGMRHG
ncbi:MAG TPA: UDP-glucose 4-epimerase GalE [Nitrospirales bacterium]|nr:UDP-glucose 4-epimerase GalE [Nitrospirales bacterium]